MTQGSPPTRLVRSLGVFDAVVIGLGSMLGAGVFAAFAPAARAAGAGLLIGLGVAALVAYCNAMSSARLAVIYPESGGAYVYGRRRLGEVWGYLAGWAFVVGKTASCAAMALTFAAYTAPGHTRMVGLAAVIVLTALNYLGVRRSAWLTRATVAITLLSLTVVVVSCLAGTRSADHLAPFPGADLHGILQAAGLLFFAFAGYARITTLGEEVRDPTRTIPRAVTTALWIALAVYLAVALSALLAAGAPGLAASSAPLRAAIELGRLPQLAPAVQVGAATAALGALTALLLGVSRTVFAMARDGYLPAMLDRVHPRFGVPHTAELAVGGVVAAVVVSVDLRGAIGFSSFSVLIYYAIANAAAATLTAAERRPPRWLPILGLLGCGTLAVSLPVGSVLVGVAVLAVVLAGWAVRRAAGARRT
jgi:APA family basic amino acid/polyamine antiporter